MRIEASMGRLAPPPEHKALPDEYGRWWEWCEQKELWQLRDIKFDVGTPYVRVDSGGAYPCEMGRWQKLRAPPPPPPAPKSPVERLRDLAKTLASVERNELFEIADELEGRESCTT